VNLIRSGGFWKVAHRGGASLASENTLAAVRAALALGVDMVELDVVAAGGELRIAHSLEQIGAENPSLQEVLAFFQAEAPPSVTLDLDLKTPGAEAAVLAALRHHELLPRTLLTSFHGAALRTARRIEPALTTGLSYPNDRYGLSARRALGPFVRPGLEVLRRALPVRLDGMVRRAQADAAMLHHALVSAPLVERCHRRGTAVFAWTVEGEEDLARMLRAGVDGVIANDPGLLHG
jgi:glycerophosphoryl diester phosphodiesterase